MSSAELLCSVCQLQAYKYKCPRCLVRSCSLVCSKEHKDGTGCSGKRDRAAFVSMNDYNANTMLSDYQFLEDVTSTIGQFERQKNGDARLVKRKPYSDGGIRFKHLRQQCQRRNIQLHLMNGLKRHSENTSQFKFKENAIFWRMDWIVQQCADEAIPPGYSRQQEFADERKTVKQLYEDMRAAHIGQLQDINDVRLFMKKYPAPANRPTLIPVDVNLTLQEALRLTTIIEYPDIYVFPESLVESDSVAGFVIESAPILMDSPSKETSVCAKNEEDDEIEAQRESALEAFDASLIAQNDPETARRLASALLSDLCHPDI